MNTKKYSKLKTIIEVMSKYGITPVSKVKRADFVKDMGFDKVYLNGLIFDVENALQVELNEEIAYSLKNPDELIQYMLQYQN